MVINAKSNRWFQRGCNMKGEAIMKKRYISPRIVVRGTIEEITQGNGWGIKDFFVFGISDPIGSSVQASYVVGS